MKAKHNELDLIPERFFSEPDESMDWEAIQERQAKAHIARNRMRLGKVVVYRDQEYRVKSFGHNYQTTRLVSLENGFLKTDALTICVYDPYPEIPAFDKPCPHCDGVGSKKTHAGWEKLGKVVVEMTADRTCPNCRGTGKDWQAS